MNEPVFDNQNNISQEKNEGSLVNSLFDVFEMFVISLAVVVLIFTFAFRLCNVQGPSMENTLLDSQKLLITDIGYTPARGDIVVFHQTENENSHYNEPIVKRVIATEGQWIDIDFDTWTVTVYDADMSNKTVLDESEYIKLESYGFRPSYDESEYPKQVPKGHIFVMGDNRYNSTDSRSDEIGFVDVRRVLGKVVLRVAPLDSFGTIN